MTAPPKIPRKPLQYIKENTQTHNSHRQKVRLGAASHRHHYVSAQPARPQSSLKNSQGQENDDAPDCVSTWRSWQREIAAIAFALLGAFALFLTLYLHQSKPVPKWPLAITINALISIYGIIIKACTGFIISECISQAKWAALQKPLPLRYMQTFDAASRGFWGYFPLIWHLRKRHRDLLLSLSAFIAAALCLVLDPTLQQIVQYPVCKAKSANASAKIPRLNFFDHPEVELYQLQSIAESALSGYVSQDQSDVNYECPPGSTCDFPGSFWTGAICGTCVDRSEVLYQRCNASHGVVARASTRDMCSYVLPATTRFDNDAYLRPLSAVASQMSYHVTGDEPGQIGKFDFIFNARNSVAYNTTLPKNWAWSNKSDTVGAATCSFNLCTQRRSAHIMSNRLSELIHDEVVLGTGVAGNGDQYWNVLPVDCIPEDQRIEFLNLGLQITDQYSVLGHIKPGKAIYLPPNFDCSKNITQSIARDTCKRCFFGAQDNGYARLSDLTMLIPNMTAGDAVVIDGYYLDTNFTRPALPPNTPSYSAPTNVGISPAHRFFYESGLLTYAETERRIQSVANVLTSQLRSSTLPKDDYNELFTGQSFASTTCVRINWAWITLAVILVILTLFLLFATIHISRSGGVASWKSSCLPLILHVSPFQVSQVHGLRTITAMEHLADHVELSLESDGVFYDEIVPDTHSEAGDLSAEDETHQH